MPHGGRPSQPTGSRGVLILEVRDHPRNFLTASRQMPLPFPLANHLSDILQPSCTQQTNIQVSVWATLTASQKLNTARFQRDSTHDQNHVHPPTPLTRARRALHKQPYGSNYI
jgi:hypothetical protein